MIVVVGIMLGPKMLVIFLDYMHTLYANIPGSVG